MFDLEPYKHPDHKERRASELPLEDLCIKQPEERTLPYFAISVEQLDADENYQNLNGVDKGDFLRLLPAIWRANGLIQDFAKAIAKELGLTEEGWNVKRALFIEKGLLEQSPDGVHLLNRGLRQQYLNTLKKANSRRNKGLNGTIRVSLFKGRFKDKDKGKDSMTTANDKGDLPF